MSKVITFSVRHLDNESRASVSPVVADTSMIFLDKLERMEHCGIKKD
jgi:hypothetical protein